jgi:hypothetical protein
MTRFYPGQRVVCVDSSGITAPPGHEIIEVKSYFIDCVGFKHPSIKVDVVVIVVNGRNCGYSPSRFLSYEEDLMMDRAIKDLLNYSAKRK